MNKKMKTWVPDQMIKWDVNVQICWKTAKYNRRDDGKPVKGIWWSRACGLVETLDWWEEEGEWIWDLYER